MCVCVFPLIPKAQGVKLPGSNRLIWLLGDRTETSSRDDPVQVPASTGPAFHVAGSHALRLVPELEEVEKMKPPLGCAQSGADDHPLRRGWKEVLCKTSGVSG